MLRIISFIVNLVLGVIEFLLAARFILKFFGANPTTPFVSWIYDNSAPLISPFGGIFPTIGLGNFLIDSTALIALVVYVLIGYVIMSIFSKV